MQVSLENTSELGRRLSVEIPAAQLSARYQEKLKEAARNAKIDGFRKGHVSKSLLEKRYGAGIRQELLSESIEQSLKAVLQEKALQVVDRPQVDKINWDDFTKTNRFDANLRYVADFEVYPEGIVPTNWHDFSVKQPSVAVTDADVEAYIARLQKQWGQHETVERASEMGDRLIIDYTMRCLGDAPDLPEPVTETDVTVDLGSNRFIEGFEQALEGKSADESCEFDLVFPADWPQANLAGQPVQFSVKVNAVKSLKSADLDMTFAQNIGSESSELAAIQAAAKLRLERECEQAIQHQMRESLAEQLQSQLSFPVPTFLLEQEKQRLHQEMHQAAPNEAKTCAHQDTELADKALPRVRLSLLLGEVIRADKISITERDFEMAIRSMLGGMADSPWIHQQLRSNPAILRSVQERILTERALDALLKKVQLDSSTVEIKELLKW